MQGLILPQPFVCDVQTQFFGLAPATIRVAVVATGTPSRYNVTLTKGG